MTSVRSSRSRTISQSLSFRTTRFNLEAQISSLSPPHICVSLPSFGIRSDSDPRLKSSRHRSCPSWLIDCGLGARNIKLSTNSVAVNTVSSHVAGYESMYFSACAAAGSKLVEAAEAIVSQLCDGNYVKSPMLLWERLVIGFVIMRWHFSLHLLGDTISFSC